MILTGTTIDPIAFEQRTGWSFKPQGACKGDMCVPMPAGELTVEEVAPRLGMPIVRDSELGLIALGPEAMGRALASAEMPALRLPDRNGNEFDLASLRGQKVLLLAWASW